MGNFRDFEPQNSQCGAGPILFFHVCLDALGRVLLNGARFVFYRCAVKVCQFSNTGVSGALYLLICMPAYTRSTNEMILYTHNTILLMVSIRHAVSRTTEDPLNITSVASVMYEGNNFPVQGTKPLPKTNVDNLILLYHAI